MSDPQSGVSEMPPLIHIYKTLLTEWGPQGWWPGETQFEVVVGAILTQNTAWSNVERAIAVLSRSKALTPQNMEELPVETLAQLIVPAGYYNLKARRLKNFIGLLRRDFDGDLDRLFRLDTEQLRNVLLAVNGIGPETADSILLYAAGRPVFVVDAYTRRFMQHHGWLAGGESYAAVAGICSEHLPADVELFSEFHALIVRLGKEHCRRRPRCAGCPLNVYPLKKD